MAAVWDGVGDSSEPLEPIGGRGREPGQTLRTSAVLMLGEIAKSAVEVVDHQGAMKPWLCPGALQTGLRVVNPPSGALGLREPSEHGAQGA